MIMGIIMASVQYAVAIAGLWNLAAFAAGVAGLLVSFPLARRFRGQQQENGTLELPALLVALSGYLVLVIVILAVQLIPAVHDALGGLVIRLDFPETRTALGFVTPAGTGRALPLFRHTGTVLFYASALAYLIYRAGGLYEPGAPKRIVGGTIRRVMASSVSIASMVTMAVIMEQSGMTNTLAEGLAQGVGRLFPAVAPWIGAIGAFMTGSNTNSNVVFGALQLRTAELLGFSAAAILAGQTAGAALASVMAPTKVVVGASTAGMAGREGEVMRQMLVYTGLLILLISLLTLLAVWLSPSSPPQAAGTLMLEWTAHGKT